MCCFRVLAKNAHGSDMKKLPLASPSRDRPETNQVDRPTVVLDVAETRVFPQFLAGNCAMHRFPLDTVRFCYIFVIGVADDYNA